MQKINKSTYDERLNFLKKTINEFKLANPIRPENFGKDFSFPEDLHIISVAELGKLMGQLAAFRGYVTRLLGTQESIQVLVNSTYEVMLGSAMYEISKEAREGPRLVKDILMALALESSEDLMWLWNEKNSLEAITVKLRSQLTIYDQHYAALSRELSRRDTEARL